MLKIRPEQINVCTRNIAPVNPAVASIISSKISNSTAYYIPELFPNQSQNSKDEILKDLFSVNIKKNNGLPEVKNFKHKICHFPNDVYYSRSRI